MTFLSKEISSLFTCLLFLGPIINWKYSRCILVNSELNKTLLNDLKEI